MNITDEQSGGTKITDPVVRGNFLPENPTQFDYLHAIRAIASRIGNKQIFDLADAGMNLVDAEANYSSSSDTPETDAATLRATDIEGGGEFDAVHVQVAKRLERERNAARIPICIGRPIIEILAEEGAWASTNGNSVIAADCLFRKNPYSANNETSPSVDATE